jgi:hypothetical protein
MKAKRDQIFISYRRLDSSAAATAIRKTLVERFGSQTVFQDVEGIDPGAEFPKTLRDQLDRAAVVLAVIGTNWLRAANEFGQRRLDFDDDWVRLELAYALGNPEVVVMPVLVDGVVMPPVVALPQPLKELATRNAVPLRHGAWDASASKLLAAIAKVLVPDDAARRQEATEPLTPDLIRQVVTEALQSASQPGGHVLLITIDEMSRLLASWDRRNCQPSDKATLELLLARLVGRPVDRVAAYLREFFRHTVSRTTVEGRQTTCDSSNVALKAVNPRRRAAVADP